VEDESADPSGDARLGAKGAVIFNIEQGTARSTSLMLGQDFREAPEFVGHLCCPRSRQLP